MVVHVVGILMYNIRCKVQTHRDDLELENEVPKIVNLQNDSSLRWETFDFKLVIPTRDTSPSCLALKPMIPENDSQLG